MDISSALNTSTAGAARDDARLDSLRQAADGAKGKMSDEKMREIADQFEAMLYRLVLKEMRKTIPQDGILGKSFATEMYTEIVDDHMAEDLASNNNLGIDQIIYEELKAKNEKIVEDPSEAVTENGYRTLKGKNHKVEQEDFLPLHPNTETFIDLNNRPEMIELKRKDNAFLDLTNRHPVPTDRVQF